MRSSLDINSSHCRVSWWSLRLRNKKTVCSSTGLVLWSKINYRYILWLFGFFQNLATFPSKTLATLIKNHSKSVCLSNNLVFFLSKPLPVRKALALLSGLTFFSGLSFLSWALCAHWTGQMPRSSALASDDAPATTHGNFSSNPPLTGSAQNHQILTHNYAR